MKQFLGFGLALALSVGFGCGGDDSAGGGGSGAGGKKSSPKDAGTSSPKDAGTSSPKDAATSGASAPTFTRIYKDIISGSGCNGGSLCHGGMVGKLTMNNEAQAYTALVDVDAMGTNLVPVAGKADCKDSGLKRVVPKDPDNSLLMQKIEGSPPCGDAMPPTGPLSDDKIELVRSWIEAGAMND